MTPKGNLKMIFKIKCFLIISNHIKWSCLFLIIGYELSPYYYNLLVTLARTGNGVSLRLCAAYFCNQVLYILYCVVDICMVVQPTSLALPNKRVIVSYPINRSSCDYFNICMPVLVYFHFCWYSFAFKSFSNQKTVKINHEKESLLSVQDL